DGTWLTTECRVSAQAGGPQGAHQQARQVEAGDVLDRRPAALHEAAVGGHEPDLEHAVAQWAVAQAPVPGQPGGEDAADGRVRRAGGEGAFLSRPAPSRGQLGHGRAGAGGDSQLGRIASQDARGGAHLDAPGRRVADLPLGAGTDGHDGVRSVDRLAQLVELVESGRRRHTHAPSGTRCVSPHRLPRGRIFCGLALPTGSNASRSRACTSRSSLVNTSGIASRFSRPMPCSPDSTPPASTHVRRIASPAACTRSQIPGSRWSKTMSGCRFPSPAWNTFIIVRSYSPAISYTRCSTSTSRVRGTTASWR